MKKNKWYTTILTTCCVSALAAPSIASAQNNSPDQARSDGKDVIVVTSRRREENLQDVPISVTVQSGEELEARGLEDVLDLTNFTPNLEINNGRADGGRSTAQIFIRGVGQNDFLIPNDPGVGLYVDDIYVSRSTGGIVGLLDVQQIEVLRASAGNTLWQEYNWRCRQGNKQEAGI